MAKEKKTAAKKPTTKSTAPVIPIKKDSGPLSVGKTVVTSNGMTGTIITRTTGDSGELLLTIQFSDMSTSTVLETDLMSS